jgi:hypothetical protein
LARRDLLRDEAEEEHDDRELDEQRRPIGILPWTQTFQIP